MLKLRFPEDQISIRIQKLPKLFQKLPNFFSQIRDSLNKNKFNSANLYFQDEPRFRLKTFVGRCLSKVVVRPLVAYQHLFQNTYLWGSYSPITGDSFVWEINGVDNKIFQAYLWEFAKQNP